MFLSLAHEGANHIAHVVWPDDDCEQAFAEAEVEESDGK